MSGRVENDITFESYNNPTKIGNNNFRVIYIIPIVLEQIPCEQSNWFF